MLVLGSLSGVKGRNRICSHYSLYLNMFVCRRATMFGVLLFVYLHVLVSSVSGKAVFYEVYATGEEVAFLKKYGYLPKEQGDFEFTYTGFSLRDALKKMQEFAGIAVTGELDEETKSFFSKKRCGVKDIEDSSRKRRYILQQGWNKHDITYKVVNGSSTLSKSRVEELMARGLAMWAPYGGIHFHKIEDGDADITVSFASEDHGDGFPFDGMGHVVAHAFPPPHGAMHFDDDELWSGHPDEENEDTTDFFAVAVHEIGHALGLSHSKEKESVMYPYYQVPVEKLNVDDILGMQELYMKEEITEAPVEVTESPVLSHSSLVPKFTKADSNEFEDEDIPDLCYTNYDTIQVIQGKMFVFEEEWMWVLSDRKVIDEGYPKRFHKVFVGLPEHVNIIKTIYERQNGNIVIFSGKNLWEFDPYFQLVRRGRITEYGIPAHIPELTTVFLSNYNNKTYLIEYEQFWRFDEATHRMDRGYPKEMSAWRQVPYPVDAAVIWKGDTYFFRGPRFWRFDNTLIQASGYYPLPTAQIWFPCPYTPDMDKYVTNDVL